MHDRPSIDDAMSYVCPHPLNEGTIILDAKKASDAVRVVAAVLGTAGVTVTLRPPR